MVLTTALAALLSVSFARAIIPEVIFSGNAVIHRISISEELTTNYFDQLIDHSNPNLGTFQQRYWLNLEFYESHGPIILLTPGEANAEDYIGYLTNKTINGMIAQEQKGATIVLEHRFFGYSNPYDNLTSQSLELLTIQQAIDDLVYFAENVDLPMPGGDDVKPDTTPWILIGGSYAGALTSWTMVNKPGVFRAGYASSAVVEAITDFYEYFTPILEYMPQNCSSDVQAVIAHLDEIHAMNDTTAIQRLKEAFGLGGLSHIDDFATALQINLEDWQQLSPSSGPGGMFFHFCDALEVRNGVNAPVTGWGLEHAIDSWGSFWNDTYYAYLCGAVDAETCLGSYNTSESFWTNVTVDNYFRSWTWMVCNQVGFFQDGPPQGQPAIVSRILKPIRGERWCVNMFPDKFASPPSPSAAEVNKMYNGWNVRVDRLFFANAHRDPWREATVSACHLNKSSTEMQPIYMSDGFHTDDMITENGRADKSIYAVQMAALKYMKTWLA